MQLSCVKEIRWQQCLQSQVLYSFTELKGGVCEVRFKWITAMWKSSPKCQETEPEQSTSDFLHMDFCVFPLFVFRYWTQLWRAQAIRGEGFSHCGGVMVTTDLIRTLDHVKASLKYGLMQDFWELFIKRACLFYAYTEGKGVGSADLPESEQWRQG